MYIVQKENLDLKVLAWLISLREIEACIFTTHEKHAHVHVTLIYIFSILELISFVYTFITKKIIWTD